MAKRGSIYWQLNDGDWLYQKYWIEELSMYKIAKKVGCWEFTVKRGLKRCGIKIRSESKYPQLNNKKWLYQKYWIEQLSTCKIGRIVGCDSAQVWYVLKRYGIKIRSGSKYPQLNDKKWLYQKYWIEGLSTVDIGVLIGCSCSPVRYALKKYNIKIRTQSECKKGERHYRFGKGKFTLTEYRLNKSISKGIRRSLKDGKKGNHWEKLVEFTLENLIKTLEKEFRGGMSWKNYGKWHIDHIIPLARFNYDSPEDPEFKKAWALNNLQPLWADENFRKNDRFMFF